MTEREQDARYAFLEMHSWSEILLIAQADLDGILDAYYFGKNTEADRMLEAAKDKAWQIWKEKGTADASLEARMAIEFEEYIWRDAA